MDVVRADAAMRRRRIGLAAEGADHGIQVPGAEPAVDLRNQVRHVLLIALGQAAEHIDPADFARQLALDRREDDLDGLFLRVADETAGIDELDIDRTHLLLRHDLIGVPYLVQEMLGIDGVLGAPQGYDLQGRH